VIEYVTDPRTGLPRKMTFLPSVAEVGEACEREMAPIISEQRRVARQSNEQQSIQNKQMAPEARERINEGFRELGQVLKAGPLQQVSKGDD